MNPFIGNPQYVTPSQTPGFLAALSGTKLVLYWGIGAIALVALAGWQPSIAIWLAVILIVGVLLIHWNDVYSKFFSQFGFVQPGGK